MLGAKSVKLWDHGDGVVIINMAHRSGILVLRFGRSYSQRPEDVRLEWRRRAGIIKVVR